MNNRLSRFLFFKGGASPAAGRERLGLAIIFACLVVSAVILVFVLNLHRDTRMMQYRAEGQRLMHVFPKIPMEAHAQGLLLRSILQASSGVERDSNFAYLAVFDAEGHLRDEVIRPGVLVPAFAFSRDPSTWYSERVTQGSEGGPEILEFSAPLFNEGELAGLIRLGFLVPGFGLGGAGWDILPLLALPVLLLGAFFYYLFKRETRPIEELNTQLQQLLEGSNPVKRVSIKKSGTMQEVLGRLNILLEHDGTRIRELEQKQMSQLTADRVLLYKKESLEAILEVLPEGVLVVDGTLAATFANRRFETLLGCGRRDVLGRGYSEWCTDPALSAFFAGLKGSRGGLHRAKLDYQPQQLPDRTVAVHAFPLVSRGAEGISLGTLVVFRDVTSEVLAKKARSEFVTHLAHEIKSPLNVMRMYSELLLDNKGEKEFSIEAVNTIYDEVERLSTLINSLLSISKIEMGSLSLERQRIKLLDLLRDTFQAASRNGRGADLRLHIDLPHEMSHVAIDKDLFRIALNNLLTNAIKYNRPGGSVTLAAEETEGFITIRVRDTGVGIAAEDRERIFDKFFRSSREEIRDLPGHGLGLPLARSIVELHQGRLSVESEPGKGTEFTIALNKGRGLIMEAI